MFNGMSIPEDMERNEKEEVREILEHGVQREGYWDNA